MSLKSNSKKINSYSNICNILHYLHCTTLEYGLLGRYICINSGVIVDHGMGTEWKRNIISSVV